MRLNEDACHDSGTENLPIGLSIYWDQDSKGPVCKEQRLPCCEFFHIRYCTSSVLDVEVAVVLIFAIFLFQNGFDYLLTYSDNPQTVFPRYCVSWMVSSGKWGYA